MKYKETGFRGFCHHFIVVPMKKILKKDLSDFPEAETANCILAYGYIDHEAGFTLEIMAAGRKTNNGIRFAEGNDLISSKIRMEVLEEDEVDLADEEDSLKKRFAGKLEKLHQYDVSEEIVQTREMEFLDDSRHKYCIDDVLVYLTRKGLKPEGCWVRIIGLADHWFMGTLLNEPNQNFGYHIGERVAFFVQETDDKRIICFSDMNPSMEITEQDLEDGKMLEEAVTAFNKERSEGRLIDILEIMRDSYVWVPCNAVFSDEDQKRWDEIAEKLTNDPEMDPNDLIGKEFRTEGETRMIPDILQNGDRYFFPVFSTERAMGEYGENFSKVQSHMLEVINLARNNEKKLAGIVLNAFTEPFVLDSEIWDIVENMKSRIT